jgi:diguanylate cyclase (GGDEF)-like protein
MIGTLLGAALVAIAGYLVGARLARCTEREVARKRGEELVAARNEVKRLESRDSLTGLPGEKAFEEFLQREWRRAQRNAAPLSLIVIDIDHFTEYHQQLGQETGDRCIRSIADVIRLAGRRGGDMIARYGGEGFVVVMGGTGEEGALAVASRLRSAVEELGVPHPASPTADHVTVSLGVATMVPQRDTTWQEIELIARAERALLEAKQLGRNRVAPAAAPA